MPTCFVCKQCLLSIPLLCKHFTICHPDYDFLEYTCSENDCNRTFHLINSFKKHLATHKDYNPCSKVKSPRVTSGDNCSSSVNNNCSSSTLNVCINNGIETSYTPFEKDPSANNCSIQEDYVSSFLSKLYANPLVPRNVVQTIVDDMSLIFDGLDHTLRSSVSKLLMDGNISNECFDHFNSILEVVKHPFNDLNTEYKRFKYYTKLGTYIPPQEYVVGEQLNENRQNNNFALVPVNCTQQFIPIRHVFYNFFKMKNVLSETLLYLNKCKLYNSALMNFTQGSVWRKKQKDHKSQIVLPIFLFFDDYEVGNPLGSHSGIHKLGAVYVSIPCLPPHRQSSLNTIFLTLLFHSSDRQKFGNNIIFKPVIDELNFLRETGIDIDTDDFNGNIKFELGLIIGDNLGIHSITGFVESFSATHVCRMCKIEKKEMKKQCYADENLLRNLEQYHLDVIEGNVSDSGVKEACVWHDVLGFSVLDQVGVDIMHDLLEGVCKYDLSFLLLYYIQDLKLFSLQVLNERLLCFDYGPDKGSKPCILHIEHLKKNTIRLSASEMMSLTRYLGLIIGDFVPRDETVWELYILLRKILDLLTSPLLQKECCVLLQTLVAEHHDLYIKFSKFELKPKYHYMVHYHTMMEKFGPLISLWSMRFEAKHRISKISANTSSNRRNICKTLAIKHQLQLNNIFIKGTLSDEIKLGPCTEITDDIDRQAIRNFIQKNSLDSIINCPWISVKGTRYTPKMILTLDICELDGPHFCC
ncbi:unnamed protein product [Macrosiphum euphorbiae]|uniref:C2H2-type domain-containing protein n=1 Tax=Macrosiphum euphorbiae TaxID=13131 RepID=A0AAV0XQ60_9HEMI|nr:unnamed protein product [Macrosiphum euphorbiae]